MTPAPPALANNDLHQLISADYPADNDFTHAYDAAGT